MQPKFLKKIRTPIHLTFQQNIHTMEHNPFLISILIFTRFLKTFPKFKLKKYREKTKLQNKKNTISKIILTYCGFLEFSDQKYLFHFMQIRQVSKVAKW